MSSHFGICKNYDKCYLADKDVIQEVESTEFVCAECGKPLYEVKNNNKPKTNIRKWLKIAITILIIGGIATGCYLFSRSCNSSKVRITVISENETMGAVKGNGNYNPMEVVTIEATAYEGYRFKSWDDDNTNNPRQISAKENITYKALFEPTSASVKITVWSSDESMGTVRGGGKYIKSTPITIEAISNEGCQFVSWDDGNMEKIRKIIADHNQEYVARFENSTTNSTDSIFMVKVEASNPNYGTAIVERKCAEGTERTITAIPKDGYEFVKWSDGNTDNPRTISVQSDHKCVAEFTNKAQPIQDKPKQKPQTETGGTIYYSFGKYVGALKNGIPEGNGTMYYTCDIQIAKHINNPPHYAASGDKFVGTWGNGDIVSGILYDKNNNVKEKILGPKRFNPYNLNQDKCSK